MLNLDTHILLCSLRGDLKAKERKLLKAHTWSVSGIVLWELTKLVQLQRVQIDLDDKDFKRDMARIHIWPIDWEVCRAIRRLDFKSDPADEIIAATSIAHQIPLLTRDQKLLQSKITPLAR